MLGLEEGMDMYLIRHGQSTSNRGDESNIDFPPLTELGHKQARLAGAAIKNINPVKIYCSPMLRAIQTAKKIGDQVELVPHVIVELHEGGETYSLPTAKRMDGLTRSEILEFCPDAVLGENVTEEGWRSQEAHTKEEGVRLIQRNMEKVMGFLLENHYKQNDNVAIITHGRSGSILISTILGMPPDRDYARFGQNNCGISLIRISSEMTRLVFLNRTDHLPTEYVT